MAGAFSARSHPGSHRRGIAEGPLLDPRPDTHSDGCFVTGYPAETIEAFLDGHVTAFAFLGGILRSMLYDSTKRSVAKMLGDGKRQRTWAFTELQSRYLL